MQFALKLYCSAQLEQYIKNRAEGISRLLHLLDEGVHVESEKRLYM